MKKSLFILVLFSSFLSIAINCKAQSRLTIAQAIFLIDKAQSSVYDSLAKKNYSYKGVDAGFEKFERNRSFGYSQLSINFKNKRLNGISWSESVMYASTIMGEVVNSGFVFDNTSLSTFQVFRNASKGLLITLIDQSSSGYISINVGQMSDSEIERFKVNNDAIVEKFLISPSIIFKDSYRQIVDSLKRHNIEYREDSAFGEDVFIGYELVTEDGIYSFSTKHILGAYSFKIPLSTNIVYNYFVRKKVAIKNPQKNYYLSQYKGYLIAFLKWEGEVTDITYNRN